jgi:hypothetical protein
MLIFELQEQSIGPRMKEGTNEEEEGDTSQTATFYNDRQFLNKFFLTILTNTEPFIYSLSNFNFIKCQWEPVMKRPPPNTIPTNRLQRPLVYNDHYFGAPFSTFRVQRNLNNDHLSTMTTIFWGPECSRWLYLQFTIVWKSQTLFWSNKHFVEQTFCRTNILSNKHFVEQMCNNIELTWWQCQ